MKFTKIIGVTLLSLLAASTSFASSTWTVVATASGGDLNAMAIGDTLTLEVKLETSAAGEMIATAGSVNNYDTTIVSVDAVASTVAESLLFEQFFPGFGGVNGVDNLESGVADTSEQGPGQEDTFLSVLGTSGAGGDGTDPEETAQFTIVYNVIGNGTTTLRVGTFTDYADAYSGASDNIVNNTEVTITVPEPTSVAASLAGLASVFGVVAVRRRASKG
jgi:hypothetical protein